MDLEELRKCLENLSESLSNGDRGLLNARLASLASAFPFNEYEYILMFLLSKNAIKFSEYEELRENYVSANRYLELYTLAPRIFGEIWAHQYIIDLDSRFAKPSKTLDPIYEGQYDLWIEGVKVEAKSGRAINTKKRGSLVSKALMYGSRQPFWMNYQQIKLDLADVFVLIGVWVDRIILWVMSNNEVKECKYLSHQHRGGIEYQIGITDINITDFDVYRVGASEIGNRVLGKGR
jgi:hypothetical protein